MLLSRLSASATPKRITGIRAQSILRASPTAREFKVVLDNGTVYTAKRARYRGDTSEPQISGWKHAVLARYLRGL